MAIPLHNALLQASFTAMPIPTSCSISTLFLTLLSLHPYPWPSLHLLFSPSWCSALCKGKDYKFSKGCLELHSPISLEMHIPEWLEIGSRFLQLISRKKELGSFIMTPSPVLFLSNQKYRFITGKKIKILCNSDVPF